MAWLTLPAPLMRRKTTRTQHTIGTTLRGSPKIARGKQVRPATKVTIRQRVTLVGLTVLALVLAPVQALAQALVPAQAPDPDPVPDPVTPEAVLATGVILDRLRRIEMAARDCTACLHHGQNDTASPKSGWMVPGFANTNDLKRGGVRLAPPPQTQEFTSKLSDSQWAGYDD